jgi:two-component system, chemotaxis family, CheB/CheR fusion protein
MTAKKKGPEKTAGLENSKKTTQSAEKAGEAREEARQAEGGQEQIEEAKDQLLPPKKDTEGPEQVEEGAAPTAPHQALRPEKGEARKKEQKGKVFAIVGIGASAGGLEPLEAFFASIPSPLEEDLAFVVIQHLSPQHKSLIGDILKRSTALPIQEIRDGLKVSPKNVYFNPPNRDVGIYQGIFQLTQPEESRGTRLPIDHFFRSLAQHLEEKAICIVLSGTGSDGTLGLEAVKGGGGLTMAQAEDQAKYPFMPRSAIDTGLVDYVLPAEQMAGEIIRYLKHPYLEGREQELPAGQHYQAFLQKVLMLVRANTKHDFSHYKQSTIRRRLNRRMAVHKIEDIADYFRYLQQDPKENQALFKDLVICVTSFFRDQEAFKALEKNVIPNILAKNRGEAIRIWVPGCGTGEEALSIAILLDEAMERNGRHHNVQIFATDIDADGIDKARAGEYPESVNVNLTTERLKKYFIQKENRYRIKQNIREMVVYAVQNLISDPPFSHLDLISCRNLLIYLDNELQRQILPLFHFVLNPGGYLFLGTSETLGEAVNLFATVDLKWKIFQRKGRETHLTLEYPVMARPATYPRPHRREEIIRQENLRTLMERLVLEEYAPPAILINKLYEVLFFQGDIAKFLSWPQGEPSYNLLHLIQDDLRSRVLTALHRSIAERKTIRVEAISFRTREGKTEHLNLTVRPLTEGEMAGLFLLIFEKSDAPVLTQKGKGQAPAAEDVDRVAALEQELQSTKEYLQTTVEELEAANEELKSTNEELQSTNEELQSMNEELETAKEELQSTNEELVTVNTELNNKINELTEFNKDINNLLASTEIGTIFLDRDLNIKRFTPTATKLFSLIPQDVGRPIRDIAPKTEGANIYEESEKVLHTLQVKELELKTATGEIYATRILPYRTLENLIDGVVLTFIDISSQRLLSMAKNFAESIVNAVRESLLVMDRDLRVISANQAFYRTFRLSQEEVQNRFIYELGGGEWDIPRLRELLEEIIPRQSTFNDFEVEHVFSGVGRKSILLNARRVPATGEYTNMILLAIEDVTGRESGEANTPQQKDPGEGEGRGGEAGASQ